MSTIEKSTSLHLSAVAYANELRQVRARLLLYPEFASLQIFRAIDRELTRARKIRA